MNVSLQQKPLIALRAFYDLPAQERNEILIDSSKSTDYILSLAPNGSGLVCLDKELFNFMKESLVEFFEDEEQGMLFTQGGSLYYAVPIVEDSYLNFNQMKLL